MFLAFWSTTLGPSRDMLEMTDLVLDVNDLALAAVLGYEWHFFMMGVKKLACPQSGNAPLRRCLTRAIQI